MQYPTPQETPRISVGECIVNDLVERGLMFTVQKSIQGIDQNSVVDIMFDLSGAVTAKKKLYLVESIFTISSGEARAQFYLPGDYDGGIALTAYNRDETSDNAPTISLSYEIDGDTIPGAELPTSYQLSADKHSAGSGASGDDFDTKVNPALSRLLRVTHIGTSKFNLEIRLIWAEI